MGLLRISIVIPAFNAGSYISQCLESILSQDYDAWEAIVGNDGSTDNTADVVRMFAARDARIRLLDLAHIGWPNAVRAECVMASSFEYVVLLDADDYIEAGFLRKICRRWTETGADFVGAKSFYINEEGRTLRQIPSEDFNSDVLLDGKEALSLVIYDWQFALTGGLWRKELFLRENSWYKDKQLCPDEYELRLTIRSCSLVAFSDAVYFYRVYGTSFSQARSWKLLKAQMTTDSLLLSLCAREYGYGSDKWGRTYLGLASWTKCALRYYHDNRKKLKRNERREMRKVLCSSLKNLADFRAIPILWQKACGRILM